MTVMSRITHYVWGEGGETVKPAQHVVFSLVARVQLSGALLPGWHDPMRHIAPVRQASRSEHPFEVHRCLRWAGPIVAIDSLGPLVQMTRRPLQVPNDCSGVLRDL